MFVKSKLGEKMMKVMILSAKDQVVEDQLLKEREEEMKFITGMKMGSTNILSALDVVLIVQIHLNHMK